MGKREYAFEKTGGYSLAEALRNERYARTLTDEYDRMFGPVKSRPGFLRDGPVSMEQRAAWEALARKGE